MLKTADDELLDVQEVRGARGCSQGAGSGLWQGVFGII